eukprot:15482122-Alexandrium_andersonii.AAC.1
MPVASSHLVPFDPNTEQFDDEMNDGADAVAVPRESAIRPILPASAPVRHLRARLKELGGAVWGTKQQLHKRLLECEAIADRNIQLRQDLEARADEIRENAVPEEAQHLDLPEAPSEAVRLRHNLTHLPAAPWCMWCVLGKSLANPHRA